MSTNLQEMLSTDLVTHVTAMCGERGEEWFRDLPCMIATLEDKWSIKVDQPFPGIEYNFVASAVSQDGTPVVLKIAPPFETTEIHGEAKFLRTLNGHGAVRLLHEDREAKAILIERALPGRSLVETFEDDPIGSVAAAIKVLQTITAYPPPDLTDVPTLDNWFRNFHERYPGSGFSEVAADRAIGFYQDLTSVAADLRYLHGDFHLGNVVTSDRSPFLAIDPKGIVGHVGYEAAVFLINIYRWQQKDANIRSLLDSAVHLFAEGLDLTPQVIRQWAFVHTVIGAWWNYEDMPALFDASLAMPDIWDV